MTAFRAGAIKGFIYNADNSYQSFLINQAGKIVWSEE